MLWQQDDMPSWPLFGVDPWFQCLTPCSLLCPCVICSLRIIFSLLCCAIGFPCRVCSFEIGQISCLSRRCPRTVWRKWPMVFATISWWVPEVLPHTYMHHEPFVGGVGCKYFSDATSSVDDNLGAIGNEGCVSLEKSCTNLSVDWRAFSIRPRLRSPFSRWSLLNTFTPCWVLQVCEPSIGCEAKLHSFVADRSLWYQKRGAITRSESENVFVVARGVRWHTRVRTDKNACVRYRASRRPGGRRKRLANWGKQERIASTLRWG